MQIDRKNEDLGKFILHCQLLSPPSLLLKLVWDSSISVGWRCLLIQWIQEILSWIETEKVFGLSCLISMSDAECEFSSFPFWGESSLWTEGLFWGPLGCPREDGNGMPCVSFMCTEPCWEAWFRLSESKRLMLWPQMSWVNHPLWNSVRYRLGI